MKKLFFICGFMLFNFSNAYADWNISEYGINVILENTNAAHRIKKIEIQRVSTIEGEFPVSITLACSEQQGLNDILTTNDFNIYDAVIPVPFITVCLRSLDSVTALIDTLHIFESFAPAGALEAIKENQYIRDIVRDSARIRPIAENPIQLYMGDVPNFVATPLVQIIGRTVRF